jgi:hypothetical protein
MLGRATSTLAIAVLAIALGFARAAAGDENSLQLGDAPKFQGQDTPAPPHEHEPPEPKPQPAQPPATPVADPCQVDFIEKSGIVTLDFSDPSRAGQIIKVTLDEIVYAGLFDGSGHLHFEAPMFHPVADLQWPGRGGAVCRRSGVAFEDYGVAYRMALVWDGTYDLRLNVVEPPDGKVGGDDHYISPGRPNLDLRRGYGYLRSFGRPVAGTSRVWLYILPIIRNPGDDGFYFFIDFASRGNPAQSPYCGGGEFASPTFRLLHLASGSLNISRRRIGVADCGKTWSTEEDQWVMVKW